MRCRSTTALLVTGLLTLTGCGSDEDAEIEEDAYSEGGISLNDEDNGTQQADQGPREDARTEESAPENDAENADTESEDRASEEVPDQVDDYLTDYDDLTNEDLEPEELALLAADVMTTWDPAEDHSQSAAEIRAANLMTEDRADMVGEPERPRHREAWMHAQDLTDAISEPSVTVTDTTEDDEYTRVIIEAWWTWTPSDDAEEPIDDGPRTFDFHIEPDGNGNQIITDYEWLDQV